MSAEARLLLLDYPGRRAEAHLSELHLEESGFDCFSAMESPLPTALTTPAYAEQLSAQQHLDRPLALVAYCAAAPLAVAMTGLLTNPGDPLPIVLLDPQPTPPDEIVKEYREVVRQVEGKAAGIERPPLVEVESLLGIPELLVERIREDLRLRARLALESYGFGGADISGPVDGVVGVYVEWLTFLVAAHHDEQPPPTGPILQVISRGHPDDAGWLGVDVQTVRINCDRKELAGTAQTRAAVLDFLHQFALPASTGLRQGG